MLMGFFQSPNYNDYRKKFGEEFGGEENLPEEENEIVVYQPSQWFAQDICKYDYSQLPQEPVPLPLSDSDISVCSLSTVPTELSVPKDISYVGEGEEEGEMECIPECECPEIETDSEPCGPTAEPCAIEIVSERIC